MRAMVLVSAGEMLSLREVAMPVPGAGQVLSAGARVRRLPNGPAHRRRRARPAEAAARSGASDRRRGPDGRRLGVPWLGWTDGECRYCATGRENLCDRARFTGYDIDGGYAEWVVADERYCLPLPDEFEDLQVAPLLCAGLIGYRSLRLAGDAERSGCTASARPRTSSRRSRSRGPARVRVHAGRRREAQAFARELGAEWAGSARRRRSSTRRSSSRRGELVPAALARSRRAAVVCAGIHMSDIPSFPYELLWGERVVRSVANLTRRDGEEFLELAPRVPVRTQVETFPLGEANERWPSSAAATSAARSCSCPKPSHLWTNRHTLITVSGSDLKVSRDPGSVVERGRYGYF